MTSNFGKFLIFLLSAVFGAAAYIIVALFPLLPWPKQGPVVERVENKNLGTTTFDGAFELYAVTHEPVDLGYAGNGAVFFLNRSGELVKNTMDSAKVRGLSDYLLIDTDDFEAEIGCTAMAFHPEFASKDTPGYGKFYVSYAEKADSGQSHERIERATHQEVIYEFTTENPDADRFKGTRREVLRLDAPPKIAGNVITDLTFDNEGFLYVGVSDLGSAEESLASDLLSMYGKVLRIDPLFDHSTGQAYKVPRNNPFYLVKTSLPELWSYGLRNPHTISYDPFRDWICISDTGEDLFEEINVSEKGAEFFGWNLAEGAFFYPPSAKVIAGEEVNGPRLAYARGGEVGKNVGGIIYRGERFPYLDGKAIFADEKGQLLTGVVTEQKENRIDLLKTDGSIEGHVTGLKEGPAGELFVFCKDGKIFELNKGKPQVGKSPPYHYMIAQAGKF